MNSNMNSNMVIKVDNTSSGISDRFVSYPDYYPREGGNYFINDPKVDRTKMSILIPMYNEPLENLLLTLTSIHSCILDMVHSDPFMDVNILVVLDGWKVTHKTVKEYLKQVYPDVKAEFDEIEKTADPISTCIVQKIKDGKPCYVPIADTIALKLAFLIKKDNRRKHNSHEWFLKQYAPEMEADYVFLTDCSTLFEEKCLTNLYREIHGRDDCVGVSGRQRVMSEKQQGDKDGLRGWFYRSMQWYDYEACLSCFNIPFSFCGMLPVIPGPCGLYNFKLLHWNMPEKKMIPVASSTQIHEQSSSHPSPQPLQSLQLSEEKKDVVIYVKSDKQDAIDYYTEKVKQNPEETGMIEASLMLAEDRILSYACVLLANKRCYTIYVPDAIFYFEAETQPTQLLQQRRRWINGTVAGYIWLLSNINLLWTCKLRLWEKLALTFLFFSQMMMFVVLSMGAMILTIGLRFVLISGFALDDTYILVLIGGYIAMYVVFVMIHFRPPKEGQVKPKLYVAYFDIVTVVNALISAMIFVALVYELSKIRLNTIVELAEFKLQSLNVLIILLNILLPFILAIMHSWTSFFLMLKTFIPFVLLLPTFTVYFSTYAFSRLWELTWGNRPSDKLLTIKQEKSEEELKQIQDNLRTHAKSVIFIIVALNVVGTFLFTKMQFNYTFILLMELLIFSWALMQMILSAICFILYNIKRLLKWIWRLLKNQSTSRKKEDLTKNAKKINPAKLALEIAKVECQMRAYSV